MMFDCPEGHEGCRYAIPFTPPLGGTTIVTVPGETAWTRTGDTFETLTLSPRIRNVPKYESREQALAAGCDPEWAHPRMWCGLHVHIRDGQIEFCGDSR